MSEWNDNGHILLKYMHEFNIRRICTRVHLIEYRNGRTDIVCSAFHFYHKLLQMFVRILHKNIFKLNS